MIASEIAKGKKYAKRKHTLISEEACLVPIMTACSKVTIESLGKKSDKKVIPVKSLGRFQWVKVPHLSRATITSVHNELIVGNPIELSQRKETGRDLVLVIFIDGLADLGRFEMEDLSKLMPHTSKFFSSGSRFARHFANAEWTLPSVATMFTGLYTDAHGLYHHRKDAELPPETPVLSEYFNNSGYQTLNVGGNWRMSPRYGYTKGFDRTIYKHSMLGAEVIDCFIENNRAFKNRSQFAWLTFMDIHHELNIMGGLDVVADDKDYTQWPQEDGGKSVFKSYSTKKVNNYISNIKSLDERLALLYSYLERSYPTGNITVLLTSDHGQSFLSPNNSPLKDERVMVPMFLKSPVCGELGSSIHEVTECLDIPLILLKESSIMPDHFDRVDGLIPRCLGGNGRTYPYSQSIFPGQTFKSRFSYEDKVFFVESEDLVVSLSDLPKQYYRASLDTQDVELPTEVMKHLKS